jgi:hypothetical protein
MGGDRSEVLASQEDITRNESRGIDHDVPGARSRELVEVAFVRAISVDDPGPGRWRTGQAATEGSDVPALPERRRDYGVAYESSTTRD